MQLLDEKFNFMTKGPGYVSRKNEGDKLMAFERGGLLWIFNFHPDKVQYRSQSSLEPGSPRARLSPTLYQTKIRRLDIVGRGLELFDHTLKRSTYCLCPP